MHPMNYIIHFRDIKGIFKMESSKIEITISFKSKNFKNGDYFLELKFIHHVHKIESKIKPSNKAP